MRVRPSLLRNVASVHNRFRLQVAFYDFVDDPGLQRFGRGQESSRYTHLDGFLDPGQSWQPLCTFCSRDDSEIDFGLPDSRRSHSDTVMARHRELETATERGAVYRHDDRFCAVFYLQQQFMNAR